MRSTTWHLVVVLGLMVSSVSAYSGDQEYYDDQGKHHYVAEAGFVPDAETAIRIAEAVWLPIYGDSLKDEEPFHAELVGDVWYVAGSLPEGWLGGVAEAEISKADGRILRVSHGE